MLPGALTTHRAMDRLGPTFVRALALVWLVFPVFGLVFPALALGSRRVWGQWAGPKAEPKLATRRHQQHARKQCPTTSQLVEQEKTLILSPFFARNNSTHYYNRSEGWRESRQHHHHQGAASAAQVRAKSRLLTRLAGFFMCTTDLMERAQYPDGDPQTSSWLERE